LPISTNLFIIIVEYLANTIRKTTDRQGIKMEYNLRFKISHYADDICLFLFDEPSLKAALDIIYFYNMDRYGSIWINAKPCGLVLPSIFTTNLTD
jgi:hypothetical protein